VVPPGDAAAAAAPEEGGDAAQPADAPAKRPYVRMAPFRTLAAADLVNALVAAADLVNALVAFMADNTHVHNLTDEEIARITGPTGPLVSADQIRRAPRYSGDIMQCIEHVHAILASQWWRERFEEGQPASGDCLAHLCMPTSSGLNQTPGSLQTWSRPMSPGSEFFSSTLSRSAQEDTPPRNSRSAVSSLLDGFEKSRRDQQPGLNVASHAEKTDRAQTQELHLAFGLLSIV
jgi:hypothetical protein